MGKSIHVIKRDFLFGLGLVKQQVWVKLLPQPPRRKGPEFWGGEAIYSVWHDKTKHSNSTHSICNQTILSFNLITDHLPMWWLRTRHTSPFTQVYKVPGCLFWSEENQASPSIDFLYFRVLLAYWVGVSSLWWLHLDSSLYRNVL